MTSSPQNSEQQAVQTPEHLRGQVPGDPATCKRHPWISVAPGFGCLTCATDAQRERELAADADARAAAAAKKAQQQLEARIGAAALPARYRQLTFDTFPHGDNPAAVRACQALRTYANRFTALAARGVSVLLVGGTGTGKTGLAACVANKIMAEDGATVLFMSAYAAVRHQRDTWGRKGRSEREALDDLLEPDLLILDDVGTSVGSDTELTMLFEVFNGRYGARKPTFVTSNLPMDDYQVGGVTKPGLRTYLGPRIVDRFRDDGSFTLAFDWPSLRGARP